VQSPIVSDLLKNLGGRRIGAEYRFPRMRWVLKRLLATIGSKYIAFHTDVVQDYKNIIPENVQLLEEHSSLLHDFQQGAARFLMSRKSALLNMDPGLGKTRTSITTALALGARKCLVIGPKSFLPGWQYEIGLVDDSESVIYHRKVGGGVRWSLTNYETAADFADEYLKQHWDLVIIDESLALKNRKAMRSKIFGQLRGATDRLWLLSGSPVSKFADDLFKQFQILEPKAFTSYWRFANTYCIVEQTPWATKVVGNRSGIDLRDEFADIVYTVKEHELNLDKPEMKYEVIIAPMVPQQRRIFDKFTRDFCVQLESRTLETTTVAAQLTYLQQITSHPVNVDIAWEHGSGKLELLQDSLMSERIPLPAIIWTWWKETARELRNALGAYYKIGVVTGSDESPPNAIRLFQEGKLEILILSLGVGRYGHTFNNALSAVYYDRTFDMDAFIQSQQRIAGGLRGVGLNHIPITFTLKSPMSTDELIEDNLTMKAFSFAHVAQHDLATMLRKLSVR
jgi:SNF2 family DNA or RNA helicase